MSEDVYGKNLSKVVSSLSEAGILAKIRGDDTARFVFAELNDRAVEISWAGDEGIFLEYWKGNEDENSFGEEMVSSFEAASIKAIEWLQCKP